MQLKWRRLRLILVGPARPISTERPLSMASFTISKQIDAPLDTVFGLFTNLAEAPRRIKGIKNLEVLTPGPVGVGTRFKETRVMFGRDCTEEMQITAFEPGRLCEITSHA